MMLAPKVYDYDCTGDPASWPWVLARAGRDGRRTLSVAPRVGGPGPRKGWRDATLGGRESVMSASRRLGIRYDTLRSRATKAGHVTTDGLPRETWDAIAARPVASTGPKGPTGRQGPRGHCR